MRKIQRALTIAMILIVMTCAAGCAKMQSGIHDLHGSIIGNEYYIDIFDNTGIRTLKSHGKKIDIDNNVVEEKTYASTTDEWYTTKTLSSVITITIDGRQLISCGDTCVFYDKRLTQAAHAGIRILPGQNRERLIGDPGLDADQR